MSHTIPAGVKTIAPIFGSPEFEQLEAAYTEATAVKYWEREHRAQVDVNRSKSYTERGRIARATLADVQSWVREHKLHRDTLRRQIELSKIEALLAVAMDAANRDGLTFQAHKLRYHIEAPHYWNVWPGEIGAERKLLHDTCTVWGDKARGECSVDFTDEMKDTVRGYVLCYVDRADNSKTYEQARDEAIAARERERAYKEEQARIEVAASVERYKELQPFGGFSLRPKGAWHGNMLPPGGAWALDGVIGFRVPQKSGKLIQRMIAECHHKHVMPADYLQTILTRAEAVKSPAVLLGWREAKGQFDYSGTPVAYIETEDGYLGVYCDQLAVIVHTVCPDAYAYAKFVFTPEQSVAHQLLLCYRDNVLVGIIMPITAPQQIAPPLEKAA